MSVVKRFYHSIWLFPVLLLVPLITLSALKISGSSVGVFHNLLYGDSVKDPNLVAGQPRPIRSDEWLVSTQQTIAQSRDGFPRVNHDLGMGQDMTTLDVPYKGWSTIFKPQNLVFFALPLEIAFALKWWLIGYLLILSCYFFVLTLLPGKRLLAAGLSVALFFSAFLQWWYVYGTLASLYYPLFIATAVIQLCKQKIWTKKVLLGLLSAYLIACFALVLYPPFQIVCGLVLATFLLGYFLQNYRKWHKKQLIQNIVTVFLAGVVGAAIVAAFVLTRLDVVRTINSTVYPGHRISQSGELNFKHLFSSHLGHQFMSDQRAANYLVSRKDHTNQSEGSNFLLLAPFLFIPSLLLIFYEWRRKQPVDWPLLLINILFVVFIFHALVPAFSPLAKLFLLDKVPGTRLLIGFGFLNIMVVVLFIRNLSAKKLNVPQIAAVLYSAAVLVLVFLLSWYAHRNFGNFIGPRRAILFSLPIPVITYLLLRKRFLSSVLLYLVFSIFIAAGVNPLYKGLGALTNNPLSQAVGKLGEHSEKRWVSDGGYIEHIAFMNGEPSLAGVYSYPQLNLWKSFQGASNVYNRYAHVGFNLYDSQSGSPGLLLISPDSFVANLDTCSSYLKNLDVGYIITAEQLNSRCVKLEQSISFPLRTLQIYRLENIAPQ